MATEKVKDKSRFKRQRGSMLLYAILVMAIMIVVGLGISQVITAEIKTTGETQNSEIAYYAARSGIEEWLTAGGKPQYYSEKKTLSNGADYFVSLDYKNYSGANPTNDGKFEVSSKGRFRGVEREIRIPYKLTLYMFNGTNGAIWVSENGGVNWTQRMGINDMVYKIHMLDENNGFLVAKTGGLYRTIDGWRSATNVGFTLGGTCAPSGITYAEAQDVFGINNNTAYVLVGGYGTAIASYGKQTVCKVSYNGGSWQLAQKYIRDTDISEKGSAANSPNKGAMWFFNENEGWVAIGNNMVKTTDGFATPPTEMDIPNTQSMIRMYFEANDKNHGMAANETQAYAINDGVSWAKTPQDPNPDPASYGRLHFIDRSRAYFAAYGSSYTYPYITTNGGAGWTQKPSSCTNVSGAQTEDIITLPIGPKDSNRDFGIMICNGGSGIWTTNSFSNGTVFSPAAVQGSKFVTGVLTREY